MKNEGHNLSDCVIRVNVMFVMHVIQNYSKIIYSKWRNTRTYYLKIIAIVVALKEIHSEIQFFLYRCVHLRRLIESLIIFLFFSQCNQLRRNLYEHLSFLRNISRSIDEIIELIKLKSWLAGKIIMIWLICSWIARGLAFGLRSEPNQLNDAIKSKR